MIHLGLKSLEYEVVFGEKCFYPLVFNEERRRTKILFGVCFGPWWWQNSISIASRPSNERLDKIDLFTYAYNRGYKTKTFIGQVDIETQLNIKFKFPFENNKYNVSVVLNKETIPIINFSDHHVYPFFLAGYTIKRNYRDKVFLKRK